MRKSNTVKAVEPASDLRQRAARARDAAGRFIKRPEPTEPDAVHALIKEHQAAYAEWDRLSAVWNDMEVDAPGYREAVAASSESGRREIAAYEALFSALPTTLAGAATLGTYLSRAIRRTSTYAQPTDGERALACVTAAVRRLAAFSVSPHPDLTLFALGAEFMAAWVAEDTDVDEDDTAYRACGRVAEHIARSPAVTAEGLGIKALLLARYASEDSSPSRPILAQGPITSEWSVLRQVQMGAARLADTSDMGIRRSAATEPETGIPVTAPNPAFDGLVGLLDLASATVDELQAIQSIAEHVGAVAYAYAWSPRCDRRSKRGSFPDFNDAGKLMRWLGDALTDVESAVDREVASRRPGNRLDRETRLSMRAVTLIENGDPDTIKAFALELLDHATAEARGY